MSEALYDYELETTPELTEMPILSALTRDLRDAARILTDSEARYLVDTYYTWQGARIRSAGQIRAGKGEEPNAVLTLVNEATDGLEARIKGALHLYARESEVGKWLLAQFGIGPVISAGLLSQIDITRAHTVSSIWRFAGLDPTLVWAKKTKRPWNARLKVICWHAGESFVKFSGKENCYYGKMYRARRAYEDPINEAGQYAEQAAHILATKNIRHETDAYAAYIQGKLPAGQLHARAKRYSVKMFLSHLHTVWYWSHFHTMPVRPYAISHLEHVDFVPPQHMDLIAGLLPAYEAWRETSGAEVVAKAEVKPTVAAPTALQPGQGSPAPVHTEGLPKSVLDGIGGGF